jgi:hypothetical protein
MSIDETSATTAIRTVILDAPELPKVPPSRDPRRSNHGKWPRRIGQMSGVRSTSG